MVTSALLAVALGATAQMTGQMSPTSDVSNNRVKATGTTSSRALKDIAADVFGNPGATYYVNSGAVFASDSNSCVSWVFPCKTVLGAYDKLPSTGGVINIADGSWVGGEVANQGIWLIGPDDPLFATPPAGWRKTKTAGRVAFVGASNATWSVQFSRPGAATLIGGQGVGWARDSAKPPIWVSGDSSGMAFRNFNLYGPQVAVRLGVDATGNRDRMTALIDFDNVNIQAPPDGSDLGAGPMVDAGYAYWITWRHSSLIGYAQAPLGDNRRANILLMSGAGGRSPGLWTIEDNRFAGGGGLKYITSGGASGWGNVDMSDCLLESDFVHPSDPIYWISTYTGPGTSNKVRNVSIADAPGSGATVRTPPNMPPSWLIAENAETVDGPATLMGTSIPFGNSAPGGQGQVGIISGRLAGPSDAARFAGAVGTSKIAPLALSSYPPSSSGSITVATVSGPTGLSGYGLSTSASPGTRDSYHLVYFGNGASTVGDLWVIGLWMRAPSTTFHVDGPAVLLNNTANFWTLDISNAASYWTKPGLDGAWHWVSFAAKVTAISSGGGGDKYLDLWLYSDAGVEVFQPVAYKFAAGSYVENDVREWAQHLVPVPPASTPGNMVLLPGQNLEYGLASGTNGGRQVGYGTAAPGSGKWAAGSIVWNSAPAGGAAQGWSCTTSGSPGTWSAMWDASSVGTVALNAASPAVATATVRSGSLCICTNQTTQANPVKCAVASTTLTATGPNGATDVVTYACF